jgi:serine/threonine-protein kinase
MGMAKQHFLFISASILVLEGLMAGVAIAQQDRYGAIATSASGGWGYAYDYPTRQQAEQKALKECGKSDCQVQVWFKNACGAVVKDPQGNLGWGWATTREQAEASALSGCGTGTCRIQVRACTTR